MKKLIFIFPVLLFAMMSSCNRHPGYSSQSINAIIGDVSFKQKFGCVPDMNTNEDLRIMTHLEYVEKLLRKKAMADLPDEQRQRRLSLLDLLHTYWTAGIFPRNYEYNDRTPCFIDKDGRICAVGYLIEHTLSRQAAENINHLHKYEKILAMNEPIVDSWIEASGLTKNECAMIQPTYGPPPVYSYNYIEPAYGYASAILSGINLSFNTINAIQISKGSKNNTVPVLGLIAGAGQIALGIGKMPEETSGMYLTTNESQKSLSMINIALGSSTMILSALNLISNNKPSDKRTSWNVFGTPIGNKGPGLAFNFSHRF
jgi:hypothetical protein